MFSKNSCICSAAVLQAGNKCSDIEQAQFFSRYERQVMVEMERFIAVSPVALAATKATPVMAFSDGIRYEDCMPALLLQL